MSERTDKRTTVSLAEVVWQMAEAQMSEKGFNDNFSAYCADLIRRDRERSINSTPSPAFANIFDAAANARATQAATPAPVQSVSYSKPAQSKQHRSRLRKS